MGLRWVYEGTTRGLGGDYEGLLGGCGVGKAASGITHHSGRSLLRNLAACNKHRKGVHHKGALMGDPFPAQGSLANGADGGICGRSRGKSGSIHGSLAAGPLAFPPVPAAAQRLPGFLWRPVAWRDVGLIPPTLGRSAAGLRQASAWAQVGKHLKTRLYSGISAE
jgi:hypothetical protein